jgi:CHAD domain-containing protein
MTVDSVCIIRRDAALAALLSAAVRLRSRAYVHSVRDCGARPSPEAVRRLRTATRRLWAVLGLAGRALPRSALRGCRRELKPRLRSLGSLRDIDIALAFINTRQPQNPSLDIHASALAARRRRAAGRARPDRVRPAADIAAYAANHIAGQGQAALAAALAERLGRDVARVGAARRDARADDPASIHRLRIAFRRLRYAAEVLQPALAGFTGDDLDAMHRFHSLLGRVQDLRVIGRGIERFGRARSQVARDELAPVIESIRQERADLIRAMGPAADGALSYWTGRPVTDNSEGPT